VGGGGGEQYFTESLPVTVQRDLLVFKHL